MAQELRINGDPIERMHADFVFERLPSYDRIWSDLIGNDGSSRLPLRDDFNPETNARRQRTSQYIYTALISVLCARQITQGIPSASTLPAYLDSINQLVAFYAHLGRVRDCVKRVGEEWRISDLADAIEWLYQERNDVLHNVLPPITELYGALVFVPPGEDDISWNRRGKWSDSDLLDFTPLSDHMKETLNRTLALLESSFARLHSRLRDDAHAVVARMKHLEPLSTISTQPSGSAAPGITFGDIDAASIRARLVSDE